MSVVLKSKEPGVATGWLSEEKQVGDPSYHPLHPLFASPLTDLSPVRLAQLIRHLDTVLRIHPDRSNDPQAHQQLVALNDAWESYRRQRGRAAVSSQADGFTEFGVGCSFADDDAERQKRTELMEQASKGRMNQRTLAATEHDRE